MRKKTPEKLIRLDSLVLVEVIKLAEVRKVVPDAFKLLLSDVAIPIRVKVFKYRLKIKQWIRMRWLVKKKKQAQI